MATIVQLRGAGRTKPPAWPDQGQVNALPTPTSEFGSLGSPADSGSLTKNRPKLFRATRLSRMGKSSTYLNWWPQSGAGEVQRNSCRVVSSRRTTRPGSDGEYFSGKLRPKS